MQSPPEWNRMKQALRDQRERDLALNATPQTRRLLIRPVIARLHEKSQIDDDQRRAAVEIERVHVRLTSFSRLCRASFLASRGGTPDLVPDIFHADYQDRYLPWAREASAQQFRPGVSVFGLTLLVAVDNRGLRQLADEYRVHQRSVLALLRGSLSRYAELAGWITLPALATA